MSRRGSPRGAERGRPPWPLDSGCLSSIPAKEKRESDCLRGTEDDFRCHKAVGRLAAEGARGSRCASFSLVALQVDQRLGRPKEEQVQAARGQWTANGRTDRQAGAGAVRRWEAAANSSDSSRRTRTAGQRGHQRSEALVAGVRATAGCGRRVDALNSPTTTWRAREQTAALLLMKRAVPWFGVSRSREGAR